MTIFVTGATGFIGSAIVQDLLAAGHGVLGLARSDAGAAALAAAGAEVHRGDLGDLDSLGRGAAASDGVIHTAFVHDFANLAAAGVTDLAAVEALGAALAGSGRPLVVTSGLAHFAGGRITTEADTPIRAPGRRTASRRRSRPWRWRRAACARRCCACRRRSTATATTASCRS